MKILVVQDHLRSGGTERQSLLLARAFAAAGHAAALLTFRPGGALASTLDPAVTHQVLQPFDLGLDWFAPGLTGAAQRLRPDVVLCMGRMANCYAGCLQRRLPASIVLSTMRTGKALPWLFRRSLSRTRHIIANSREAKQTLVSHHHLAGEKISVIYNSLVFPPTAEPGAPPPPPAARMGEAPRNEALRAAHGAVRATTVLLCVAMFRPEKNQRELIEIAAGLPRDLDWQLWLAGDGPTRAACARLAGERKLTARVKFLGWQRDPAPLYTAADIAIHASWSESLSNFIIEAQARGLPAVVCAAQGISECFTPGDTGFVIAHGDRAAFRTTVIALARSGASERQARAERARAHARLTFDPQQQVAAYLELFRKLASPPTP